MSVTIICKTCNQPFLVSARRENTAKFCSIECRKLGRYIPCSNCGKEIYLPRHQELYKNHFCSNQCKNDFRSRIPARYHPRFLSKDNIDDFSQEQKELIIGTILGDASILKNSNGNAHLSIAHGEKQLDYLIHKQRILEPFSRPINYHERFDERHSKTYKTYRFYTRCHPYLTDLRNLFYGDNGKEMPESIIETLTPRSFAYWFFDDGSRGAGQSLAIATLSFPLSQVNFACEIIKDRFDIECHPNYRGDIYISSYSFGRVKELIEPFMIPSMRYKIL